MNESLDEVIGQLEEHLLHEKAKGQNRVFVEKETLAALSQSPAMPSRPSSPKPSPAPSPGVQNVTLPDSPVLEAIAERIRACTICPLCEGRIHTVPGQGSPSPEVMFVGEGPGADEDKKGLAFIGRAGQLLTKIIEAMGFTRDEVFIGNIVKCRPPGNRVPLPDEMEACMPYLKEQIAELKPRVIVCLGATAVKGLLQTTTGITKLRGTWMNFEGIDVMPTFHPAYLLRNPPGKREVWEDMKEVLKFLGRPVPEKKK